MTHRIVWPMLLLVLAGMFGNAGSIIQRRGSKDGEAVRKALSATRTSAQAQATCYVAPNGNDAWSGQLAAPNKAKTDGPLATLDAARALVRKLPAGHGPVTVIVRGGDYTLKDPLVFTPEDSGNVDAPVTYAAAAGETPVIGSGQPIMNWQPAIVNGKDVWAADYAPAKDGKVFRQLWVNGTRRTLARTPNTGFYTIAAIPDATAQTPYNVGQSRFQFAPENDIPAWANGEDVRAVILHYWVSARVPVAGIDRQHHILNMAQAPRRRLTEVRETNTGARYYLENALAFLDAPGEWYLDRTVAKVYYVPMPGERINAVRVVVPTLNQLVRLDGQPDAGKYVENLTFRGIAFKYTDWALPANETGDDQGAISVPAVIVAQGARKFTLDRCTIQHTGGYAITFGRGVRDSNVTACSLSDLGAGGIKIGTMQLADADICSGNTVADNHIYDGGINFPSGIGVWVGHSHDNRIIHNHIHDLYYSAISVGWQFDYKPSGAYNNLIEYNDIHDIGRAMLSDMGGIYTLGIQPGTIIRNNRIHDVTVMNYGGFGIYLDQASSNIVVENNLVYRCASGLFHQHFGRDNTIRNNIFAFGQTGQLMRSREEDQLSFTFERNIVYYDGAPLLRGSWQNNNFTMRNNVYWDASGKPVTFAGWSFKQWQARGQDTDSLVADPLFRDPAHDDFTVLPTSPALAHGFVPFNLITAGPRSATGAGK